MVNVTKIQRTNYISLIKAAKNFTDQKNDPMQHLILDQPDSQLTIEIYCFDPFFRSTNKKKVISDTNETKIQTMFDYDSGVNSIETHRLSTNTS